MRRPVDPRPVVGIVGHGYTVPLHFGDLPVVGTPRAFTEVVADAGGRPVVLPSREAVDLLDVVDALVLTGGGDVDPAWYGGDPRAAIGVDRERDETEIRLVRAAADARVPILAVCRGLQVLAVAFGGTLRNGVPHLLPEAGHDVSTAPGSLTHRLLGPRVRTSALHQQAIADLGPSWRPTAWSDDGTVEAIEPVADDWPGLGVQWHPELVGREPLGDGTGPAVFGWLVAAALASSPHEACAATPCHDRSLTRDVTRSRARG